MTNRDPLVVHRIAGVQLDARCCDLASKIIMPRHGLTLVGAILAQQSRRLVRQAKPEVRARVAWLFEQGCSPCSPAHPPLKTAAQAEGCAYSGPAAAAQEGAS
jgi:hypothetical protein